MIGIIKFIKKPFNLLILFFVYTIIFAFFCDTPTNIINGIWIIISNRGVLITDYIALAGVGATLVNAGLSGILLIIMFKLLKLKANGSLIMAVWLCVGFAFFGKNIVNTWPIIFGGYLYAKCKKEPFMRYSLTAVLSTSLSPVINEFYHLNLFPYFILNIGIAILTGIIIGFIMIPLCATTMKAHGGFNLYNVGFAAGILGVVIMGILRGFGVDIAPRENYWDTSHKILLTFYVASCCIFLLIVGIVFSEDRKTHLTKIYKSSGRLVSDFYIIHQESTYINMGTVGLFSLAYIWLIGGDINGPTIGGIFTIIGFGAFGKHLKNIIPVMLGATLAGYLSIWSLDSHSVILAILFSTALAPITGTFGKTDGFIAGALNVFVVTNIGFAHGGLNLYNNGFAAGFVAIILVPLLTTFRKGDYN